MTQAIPLVRAIGLLPTLRWLKVNNLPVESMLRQHGLANAQVCNPMRPVPLLNVGGLLRDIARHVGPDVACQIVSGTSDRNLAQVGRVALGTKSPAEAFKRISCALPYFCSHELLRLERGKSGLVIRHFYGVRFDDETLHLMSQYALAVLDRICAMSGAARPRLLRVEMPAHPEHGVGHLARWFGTGVVAPNRADSLKVTMPNRVADQRFGRYARDRSAELERAGLQPLRKDGSFAESVHSLLDAVLKDEETLPTVDQVAEAAGLSTRTLQRRLKEDNRSFKGLLDEIRQAKAKQLITDGVDSFSDVSIRLGYAQSTSLNRAMLRWTGHSPSSFRQMKS